MFCFRYIIVSALNKSGKDDDDDDNDNDNNNNNNVLFQVYNRKYPA